MEYKRTVKRMYSEIAEEDVAILEYAAPAKTPVPYMDCTRCGRPLYTKMYVVQSENTGIELMYLGPECFKHFR